MNQKNPPVVVILTPIAVELRAVARHLSNLKQEMLEHSLYETGHFNGSHHEFTVVVHETGSKNTNVGLMTEKVIRLFKPVVVLLLGIAGGVKDAQIGDVVVGTKAYGYESGKETDGGSLSRPDVLPYSKELVEVARMISRKDDWRNRTLDGAASAKVFFGPIASGDKVIASTASPLYRYLKQHFNDTLAIEMESIGFAQAVFPYRDVYALNIRGVSDLLDHKSDSGEIARQEMAAERAAAFAFEMLNQLDCSSFIQNNMEIKDLVKEIYTLLFPAALNEIKKDFADATNDEIRAIWKKVKPLFIEEVEELAKDPEDSDTQADVRNRLKKGLEGKDELQQELAELLAAVQQKTVQGQIMVENSKNVLVNSTITAGKNVHIGRD